MANERKKKNSCFLLVIRSESWQDSRFNFSSFDEEDCVLVQLVRIVILDDHLKLSPDMSVRRNRERHSCRGVYARRGLERAGLHPPSSREVT